MEENENVEQVESTETVEAEVTNEANNGVAENKVVKFLKEKKKWLLIGVIAIIAICVIYNVFFNVKAKAKKVVKQYIAAVNKADAKKLIKLSDPYGVYVFGTLDEDEYDDFWKEYKDFIKEKDDDYDDVKDDYEDSLDKDSIKKAKENLEDMMEDRSIKVKKIKSVKKEGKNLYKVKAKIKAVEDDDERTSDMEFYVMKKGLNCYIVSARI